MNLRLLPRTVYYFVLLIILYFVARNYGWLPDVNFSDNINPIALGSVKSFIGGFVLAALFFVLLRPRVKISKIISKREDSKGQDYFTFKFINNSFFAAFDVNIEAYLCQNNNATGTGKGKHVRHNPIELTRFKWIHFPGWRPVFGRTEYAPHCITVRALDPTLENQIKDNSDYIEFRVTLKHAFSNLSSTYRVKYMNEDCVEKGKFDFGNSFKII